MHRVRVRAPFIAAILGFAALFALTAAPSSAQIVNSSISSNFNGTAISAGRYIWFNAVFKYSGPTGSPVVLRIQNGKIQFTANSIPYTLLVPNAKITLSPSAGTSTTAFDGGTNTWLTSIGFGLSGNQFLAGLSYQVPVNLPGGINPVVWSADFSSDTPNVSLDWQWAAAVYTSFSGDHSLLGVKPVDDNSSSIYLNSDHAGTPESFKSFVTGGARGGGGSNFTGSYSSTGHVNLTFAVAVETTTWTGIRNLYR